jgi:hypothetical protein
MDIGELWHQRLGHLNYHDLIKIAKKEAVTNLPKINHLEKGKCGPCQLVKQTRNPHKKTSGVHTSRNLELLHMDLMGPTQTTNLGGKKYILVVVDDYSWYTWISLLKEKSEEFDQATILFKKCKLNKTVSYREFVVTMEENLKIIILKISATNLASNRIFHHRSLHNKMG